MELINELPTEAVQYHLMEQAKHRWQRGVHWAARSVFVYPSTSHISLKSISLTPATDSVRKVVVYLTNINSIWQVAATSEVKVRHEMTFDVKDVFFVPSRLAHHSDCYLVRLPTVRPKFFNSEVGLEEPPVFSWEVGFLLAKADIT